MIQKKNRHIFALAFSIFALCGCAALKKPASVVLTGPSQSVSNVFVSPSIRSGAVKRAVMIDFANRTHTMGINDSVTESLAQKLIEASYFQVVRQPLTKEIEESYSKARFKKSLLERIQKETNADAVIMGEVTAFHAYRPIRLGIRLKMLDLKEGKVLWAVDELFDAGFKNISHFAQKYYASTQNTESPLTTWESILISPALFTGFMCHEIVRTIES